MKFLNDQKVQEAQTSELAGYDETAPWTPSKGSKTGRRPNDLPPSVDRALGIRSAFLM